MLTMVSIISCPTYRDDSSDYLDLLTNGGSYVLEAMQYVFSRFSKESQVAMVTSWTSALGTGSRTSISVTQRRNLRRSFLRYEGITNYFWRYR